MLQRKCSLRSKGERRKQSPISATGNQFLSFNPEDGSRMFLPNVGINLRDYTWHHHVKYYNLNHHCRENIIIYESKNIW
jgi:hypothetical protein